MKVVWPTKLESWSNLQLITCALAMIVQAPTPTIYKAFFSSPLILVCETQSLRIHWIIHWIRESNPI